MEMSEDAQAGHKRVFEYHSVHKLSYRVDWLRTMVDCSPPPQPNTTLSAISGPLIILLKYIQYYETKSQLCCLQHKSKVTYISQLLIKYLSTP